MARGRKPGTSNTDIRVRQAILLQKVANPTWSASDIRKTLVAQKNSLKRGYLVQAQIPQPRAIQKIIKEHRGQLNDIGFQEYRCPWQLGATVKNPIPAEAIPRILEMQEWLSGTPKRSLSVQEAKWIGRLYHVKGLETLTALWKACKLYSDLEISCELAGVALDTAEWDKSLIKGTLEQDILEAFAPPSFTGDFSGYKSGTFEIGGELKP